MDHTFVCIVSIVILQPSFSVKYQFFVQYYMDQYFYKYSEMNY